MPAPRDDDSSRFSVQKQNLDSAETRSDNQQAGVKRDANAQRSEADARKSTDGGEVRSPEAAFHKELGLDKVPLKGTVEFNVKRAEMEAQRAEGVSRAQNVCFTNQSGENLVGTQYTNPTGTYLKTRLGEKFSVSAEATGGFVLTSMGAVEQQFNAVKLTVLANFFGAGVESAPPRQRTVAEVKLPANTENAEGQNAAFFAAADQAIRGRLADLAGTVTALGSQGKNKDEGREAPTTTLKDRLEQSQDAVVGKLTGRQANSLDVVGALADLAISNKAVEAKAETNETPPPPPPFDLADILEPPVAPIQVGPLRPDGEKLEPIIVIPTRQALPPDTVVDPKEEEPGEAIETEGADDQDQVQQGIKSARNERRRRYVVKDKDTLPSIAAKQLRDRRLAELIFEINKHLIQTKVVRGRAVRLLKPRQVIYLPTASEVEEYRGRLVGSPIESVDDLPSEDSDLSESELVKEVVTELASATGSQTNLADPVKNELSFEPTSGPAAIERQTYIVRLGDTLKSVSMKHPSLSDLGLWVLLAQINHLSIEVDDRGQPVTRLVRGTRLLLPTSDEVEEFREGRRKLI
jgi:hypothetical protein